MQSLEAIEGWVWNTQDAQWEEGYRALRSFVDRRGHARVPKRHREGDFWLGRWVVGQRAARRDGVLSAERVARLESLDGWTWNTRETAWQDGYQRVVRFHAERGHADVPQHYREPDGYKLGSWVSQQRTEYRRHKLSPEHVDLLAAVPGWRWARERKRSPSSAQ